MGEKIGWIWRILMGSWDHFYDWETWLRWGISDNFFDTGVDNSIPGTITSEGGSRILGVWLPSDYQGGSLPLWVWSELMRGRLPIDRDLQCTFALDQRLSWWQSVSCTSSSSSSSSSFSSFSSSSSSSLLSSNLRHFKLTIVQFNPQKLIPSEILMIFLFFYFQNPTSVAKISKKSRFY